MIINQVFKHLTANTNIRESGAQSIQGYKMAVFYIEA